MGARDVFKVVIRAACIQADDGDASVVVALTTYKRGAAIRRGRAGVVGTFLHGGAQKRAVRGPVRRAQPRRGDLLRLHQRRRVVDRGHEAGEHAHQARAVGVVDRAVDLGSQKRDVAVEPPQLGQGDVSAGGRGVERAVAQEGAHAEDVVPGLGGVGEIHARGAAVGGGETVRGGEDPALVDGGGGADRAVRGVEREVDQAYHGGDVRGDDGAREHEVRGQREAVRRVHGREVGQRVDEGRFHDLRARGEEEEGEGGGGDERARGHRGGGFRRCGCRAGGRWTRRVGLVYVYIGWW